MKYKRLLLLFTLILIGIPVFSMATTAAIVGGIAVGVSAGIGVAGVTTAIGVGTAIAIGATVGAAGGLVSGAVKQKAADKEKGYAYEDKYLAAKAAIESYDEQIEEDEIAIRSAETKVSAYDEFLINYNDNRVQQEEALQLEGDTQQAQLMQNFTDIETVIGATGQSGASAAISADVGKQSVEQFAGDDLTLNKTGGGTFAKVWEDTEREFSDEYSSSALSKQDLYSVMDNYRASISRSTESKKLQTSNAEEFKQEANKYGRKIN